MKEVGYIKSINNGYASMMFKRKSGCGDNCASCKAHCSAASITTDVEDTLGVAVGDMVEVDIQTKSFFAMTFWTYIFPLIMMTIGLVISLIIFKKLGIKQYELLSTLVGLVFLAIAYSILGKIDKKLGKSQEYNIKMLRKIYK